MENLSEIRDNIRKIKPLENRISKLDERLYHAETEVDFWFDNIFTDVSVRYQIRDNIEQLDGLLSGLNNVETLLNDKAREINARLDDMKRKQEDLLVLY